jgi:hypothetical protein
LLELTCSLRFTEEGKLQAPHGIALDQKHNLYVADSLNHRVQVFDENQMHILTLGSEGTLPEQFLEPAALFIDPQERLYVSERGNHRIQIFQIHHEEGGKEEDNKNEVQGWGAKPKLAGEPEDEVVPPVRLELIFTLGMPGPLKSQFHFPLHMCTNVFEQLFVADSLNHRVQIFDIPV